MGMDMRMDMRMDMGMDMGMDRSTAIRRHTSLDMYMHMYMGMRKDMRVGTRLDTCMGTYMDMCVNMRLGVDMSMRRLIKKAPTRAQDRPMVLIRIAPSMVQGGSMDKGVPEEEVALQPRDLLQDVHGQVRQEHQALHQLLRARR